MGEGKKDVDIGFPAFSLVFATSLEFPRFLDFLRFSLAFATSLDSPRFLSTTSGYLSSHAFVDLRDQASISRVFDLPRLSRWSYYRVLPRHSIESIASLDLSCIACLHESIWI